VTVAVGANSLEFWPYTGIDYSGNPQDPINLIFFGEADPRDIRAALLSLDGDRSVLGLPPIPPFNCVWDDGIGGTQTGYAEPNGWAGSVIQLECGNHVEARFHLRLFQVGDWTLGGAHFEVLIPGTTEHQVVSWEVAEQFVVGDFMRSGLLDPATDIIPAFGINESPWKAIPAIIYNGLPVELKAMIEGPLDSVTVDVPIKNDGHAMILNLQATAPRQAEVRIQDFIIQYGQTVPKPFCSAGPQDYIYVAGPVNMHQISELTADGAYTVQFRAQGTLSVTPINPFTGEPLAEPFTAYVRERHSGHMNNSVASASMLMFQKLTPASAPGAGQLFSLLLWHSNGFDGYIDEIKCAETSYWDSSGDPGNWNDDTPVAAAETSTW
jgi:hypothetical protein